MSELFRYFIDNCEVTPAEARAAETAGSARVAAGGSGVVPEHLRRTGETPAEYLCPWMQLRSTTEDPCS